MEWTIDLQEFADQSINLSHVNKISIGFGDNRYGKDILQKQDIQVKNRDKTCHIETGDRPGSSQSPDQPPLCLAFPLQALVND